MLQDLYGNSIYANKSEAKIEEEEKSNIEPA
jgi:hypothetical protein